MLLDAGLLGAQRSRQVVILQPRRLPARMLAARVARERNTALGDGGRLPHPPGQRHQRAHAHRVRHRGHPAAPDARRPYAAGGRGHPLRRIPRTPPLRRHHARPRAANPGNDAARPAPRSSCRPRWKPACWKNTSRPAKRSSRAGGRSRSTIEYLPRPAPFDRIPPWELAAEELARLAAAHPDGDALVFMPGAYEISRTLSEIRNHPRLGGWLALPLHGELPPAEQDAAVARYPGRRKVVVSTNVAETSLTIDGVRIVIDSGQARIARFDPYRGINTLLVEKISRASADQRAGRAGRTAPGHCLRLWTEAEHADRPAQETPEVRRLDLAEVVLTLKASGVDDVHAFRWLEPPERKIARPRGSSPPATSARSTAPTGQISAARPPDARVPGASALRPDAARRARMGLRAARRAARRADAIAQPFHPQRGPQDGRGTRRPARRGTRVGFLPVDARVSLRGERQLRSRPLPAAGHPRAGRAAGGRTFRAVPRHRRNATTTTADAQTTVAATAPRTSAVACSSGFPTNSRGGSTRARCVASSSATGAACWRARAPCGRRGCSSPPRCARSRRAAATNSPRC